MNKPSFWFLTAFASQLSILKLEVTIFVSSQSWVVCESGYANPTATLYVKLEVPTIGPCFLGVARGMHVLFG